MVAEARELVAGLLAEPWGRVSASPYETGRVVSLAPWLAGHAGRVDYLLDAQRADGAWGPPGGYALVPTLSAVEALLAELRREASHADPGLLAKAAARGLEALQEGPYGGTPLPDLPAIELIVPSLLDLIEGHLEAGLPGEGRPGGRGPELPPGMGKARLTSVRALLASGAAVPQKLVHALEIAGHEAAAACGVAPTPMPGAMAAVGASPAASAAWLAARYGAREQASVHEATPYGSQDRRAADGAVPDGPERSEREAAVRRYLEAVVARSGGPVPCAFPITLFERGWTLSWLRRAGVPVDVPPELAASLREALAPEGAATGPGLPADADTTSVALHALALLGEPHEPRGLWSFETETHFCTWRGEEGMSPTTNAHVLDAFGEYVRRRGGEPRHTAVVAKLSAWLRGLQRGDGSWPDRWHASPYYATACCAIALHEFGGPESAGAVGRAVDWVLGGQRPDGSWGRWEGTAEETAYALQTLLLTGSPAGSPATSLAGALTGAPAGDRPGPRDAVERGYRRLLELRDRQAPPLWVDKDLYLPVTIVRAAVLGALHLTERTLALPDSDPL
ncbi:prenyltransferase/squalene oxidase repeat-containing protein [Planobispora siamensis]|uniref:prenyltransferase/squalene oxidase repeat-containing protein n=1 Tax=Planobispora siamensis TaxID=936338 RepID=UPI001EF29ADD|nr:prenyltransferase/squalene oxidase repeat-containing protein [Planobispora siamensis]